jgi:hypothetical protein
MTNGRKKPAVPVKKATRDKSLLVRVTAAELAKFDAAAAADDRKRAEWCRRVLHAAADKLLSDEAK